MDSPREFERYLKITWGMLISIIFSIAMTTFVLTSIYWRFKIVEEEQKVMELQMENHEQRLEYVNERIDRKAKQLEEKLIEEEK
jgi:hypothetical protein